MSCIPEAIKNLKLCQAFRGHNPVITDSTEKTIRNPILKISFRDYLCKLIRK